MKNSSETDATLAMAVAAGRQFLSRRFTRGREDFTSDLLKGALAEQGAIVDAVISSLVTDGLIEELKVEVPQGVSAGLLGLNPLSYRICPSIVEEVATAYLGLTIDETNMTVDRPSVCRHVVTLSPVQLKLVVAMCDAGDAGIKLSVATALRGGDRIGERQFRIAFNRSLAILDVKLDRFAWRLVAK